MRGRSLAAAKGLSPGLTASQPTVVYREKVKSVERRTRTTSQHYLTPNRQEPKQLSDWIWERIMCELDQKRIRTTRVVQSAFPWLLPQDKSTKTQLSVWDEISRSPLSVTDTELASILKLSPVTLHTLPSIDKGGYMFYVQYVC